MPEPGDLESNGEPWPPVAGNFHCEFGYLCPAPHVRRRIRAIAVVASIAATVGAMAWAPHVTPHRDAAVHDSDIAIAAVAPTPAPRGETGPVVATTQAWRPPRARSKRAAVRRLMSQPPGRIADVAREAASAEHGGTAVSLRGSNALAMATETDAVVGKATQADAPAAESASNPKPASRHARRHLLEMRRGTRW
jgi:hypothetical protein